MSTQTTTQRNVDVLGRLVFRGYSNSFLIPDGDFNRVLAEYEYVAALDEKGHQDLLALADMHHVTVRALRVLEKCAAASGNENLRLWAHTAVGKELERIEKAVRFLKPVCDALNAAGANVVVIKSLDHWPDLGSDLDLYTIGDRATVIRVMKETFQAKLEPRSWGDRLANKWNFSIPGLEELIEIHVQYLGQTGEHKALARRVMDRSVEQTVAGLTFRVTAPEEKVIISTLQRMYRHLYFRLCDMADFEMMLRNGAIDFAELKNAATKSGIWPGVATFLLLVSQYVKPSEVTLPIPREVLDAAYNDVPVYLGGNFLRVSKSAAMGLYGTQLLNAGKQVDFRALARLPLLPPLAVSALLAYKITGSDKGVW